MTPGSYLPTEYFPVFVLILISIAFGLGIILIGGLVRLRRPYKEKLSVYECGNPPVGAPREQFSIKFYIIAMLFVIFDVEAVFLYPWALVYEDIGWYALIAMILFIDILLVGYLYAWQKKAFEW